MPFQHPHVNQQTINWVNRHGTHRRSNVTRLLPISAAAGGVERWRRFGEVVKAVVQHAFDNTEPLRPDGSRWSLSNIGVPTNLALSLSAHEICEQVQDSWVSPPYQTQLEQADITPMLVSGGAKLSYLNRTLAMQDLALQTSGASNGQTLAGACATGTHGAAIHIGALHDTIRAVHLMIAPNLAVLLQPASAPLTSTAADDLTAWLDLPTELVSDDTMFHAALVHLGSLGLVLNMVLEAVPLYFLTRVSLPLGRRDDTWKTVLQRPALEAVDAYHYEVVLNPYNPLPRSQPWAWAISMTHERFANQSDVEIRPTVPDAPNPDLIGVLAKLLEKFDTRLTSPVFRKRITEQFIDLYGDERKVEKAVPGVMFGPTRSPEGRSDSLEFAFDAQLALPATEAVLESLEQQLRRGQQFPGAIGIRFVRGSEALLATNLANPTCFIELPTIRTNEIETVYKACGHALEEAGIEFGCHWGQTHLNTPERIDAWWGARAQQWRAVRQQLLDDGTARTVFASPLLADTGLG